MSDCPTPDPSASGAVSATGKPGRSRASWRARGFAGSAVLCLLVLTLWQVWNGYRDALRGMEVLSTALVRVSEEHITGIMRGIDVVLDEVMDLVPDDGGVDRVKFRVLLANRKKQFNFIRDAFVVNSTGVITAGTLPGVIGLDVHDRVYFTALAADSAPALLITPPLPSRVQSGSPIFVARAIRDALCCLSSAVKDAPRRPDPRRRHFGNHPAEPGVFVDTGGDLVGQQRDGAVGVQTRDADSCLVTGGFDGENVSHAAHTGSRRMVKASAPLTR